MTTDTTTPPHFATRSRTWSMARDLSIVALCAAIVGGFVAEVWRGPAPRDLAAEGRLATRCVCEPIAAEPSAG